MLTENDLRDVLDEWADAAVHYSGDAPSEAGRPAAKRSPRWFAPVAAAAVVAATAITVTAVAGRGPHDTPAAGPTTAPMSTGIAVMPRVTAPQQIADNFARLAGAAGHVTNLCAEFSGATLDTAFDYDDGHGAIEVQIRLQYPSTRARQAVRADLRTTTTCRPGNTAAPGVTWRAVYMNPLQRTLSALDRGIASVHRNDLVVVIAIANRPDAKTTLAAQLASTSRVGLIAADRSWEKLGE